jgi:lysozyme family protein
MAVTKLTAALAAEYEHLFDTAVLRPEKLTAVRAAADGITANMARYDAVSRKTGIPAWFIGITHNMESSLSFKGHLHNGDPLTARTVQQPKGRPTGPPAAGGSAYTWEESALDALTLKKLHQWSDWSVAGASFQFERYNGFGYRNHHPEVKSPYLWSFTTHYSQGKYTSDGKFSPTAVSKQVGAIAILKRLAAVGDVKLGGVKKAAKVAHAAAAAAAADVPAIVAGNLSPAPKPIKYPGKPLRNGSKGAIVRQLQQRLASLGIPVAIDSDFGDKTEAAVRMFQARSDDFSGAPLEIDGVVGRRTWEALFGDASVPLPIDVHPAAGAASKVARDALAVAIGQIGVMEEPPGSNRGEQVDAYLSNVDKSLLGEPWCMAFVYWCFKEAAKGGSVAAPRTAGVLRSWQLAQSSPRARVVTAAEARTNPAAIVPGMVFYIDTGSGTGHTGFVSDVVNGRLSTVEGNTTMVEGSREGIGVFARSARRIEQINVGFVEFG